MIELEEGGSSVDGNGVLRGMYCGARGSAGKRRGGISSFTMLGA